MLAEFVDRFERIESEVVGVDMQRFCLARYSRTWNRMGEGVLAAPWRIAAELVRLGEGLVSGVVDVVVLHAGFMRRLSCCFGEM